MNRRMRLIDDIRDYARGPGNVNIGDLYLGPEGDYPVTGQEIIDECTLQAATNAGMSTPDADIERRLRELVAVVMKLKELGLIE